jgi:hypothetical protein
MAYGRSRETVMAVEPNGTGQRAVSGMNGELETLTAA